MTGPVALVPARSGSKRLPGKNVRPLRGHPLLAYTIAAALESGVFVDVVVSTDSEAIAEIARHYGASVPFLRPGELAGDHSPDVEWVTHAIDALRDAGRTIEAFSILRPTSPLRQADTIRRAWDELQGDPEADSLRAVQPCAEHPGKMWLIEGERMRPLLDDGGAVPPWHSTPYQALPAVYIQNASLEIARVRAIDETRSIAGRAVRPFITTETEGFDVNRPTDWLLLERLLDDGAASLPTVGVEPHGGGTA